MGESLKKKLGPLPAWAWLLLLAAVVYFYRKYTATSAATDATAGTAPDATTATPQDPVVLEPGESVYDPNTGQLLGGGSSSSPGDSGAGSGGGNGSAGTPGDVGTADPGGAPIPPDTSLATPSASRPAVGSKAGKHGAVVAPYGPKKPPNKKGFRTVGTGAGGWIYVPVKPKPGSGSKRTAKPTSLSFGGVGRAGSAISGLKALGKPRSPAATRDARSQRKASSASARSRPRGFSSATKGIKAAAPPVRTRTGKTVPFAQKTENQRPTARGPFHRAPAQHPAQSPRPSVAAHNPARTVHTGGTQPVARPRPAPPPPPKPKPKKKGK